MANRSKLHLNYKGSSFLAKNIAYVKLKAGQYLECRDGVLIEAENNPLETLNILKFPQNFILTYGI